MFFFSAVPPTCPTLILFSMKSTLVFKNLVCYQTTVTQAHFANVFSRYLSYMYLVLSRLFFLYKYLLSMTNCFGNSMFFIGVSINSALQRRKPTHEFPEVFRQTVTLDPSSKLLSVFLVLLFLSVIYSPNSAPRLCRSSSLLGKGMVEFLEKVFLHNIWLIRSNSGHVTSSTNPYITRACVSLSH